jgi:hypothetical protein
MATNPPGRSPGRSGPRSRRVDPALSRGRWFILAAAFASALAAVVLFTVGAVLGDRLSLVSRAVGFAAASLWLIAVAAAGGVWLFWWFDPPRRRRARPVELPTEDGPKSRAPVDRPGGAWRGVRVVLAAVLAAFVVTLVALGFALVPAGGGSVIFVLPPGGSTVPGVGNGSTPKPAVLAVSWTVEEPLTVETPTSQSSPKDALHVVLRVTDPERPNCDGDYRLQVKRTGSASVELRSRDSCTTEVRLAPEVDYDVKVVRALPSPGAVGSTGVRVRRLVVASFGDSVASGEGNPAPSEPHWVDPGSGCNRSAIAGPRQAAEQVSAAESHAFVVFLHVACTGAWIDGKGAPDAFEKHPSILRLGQQTRTSQIEEFGRLIARNQGQLIVLLSVGGNDIGFRSIIMTCLLKPSCDKRRLAGEKLPLKELVPSRLAELRQSYDRLASEAPFRQANVFVTEYFDPLHDEAGKFCRISIVRGVVGFSREEARWAENAVINPLNELLRSESALRHWHFVSGIAAAFRQHGYCAKQSWIVHIRAAYWNRNRSGPFHPNALGQKAYGDGIFAAVKPYLEP